MMPESEPAGAEGSIMVEPRPRRPSSSCTLWCVVSAVVAAAFLLMGSRSLSLVSAPSSETLMWARASGGTEGAGALHRKSEASPQYDVQGMTTDLDRSIGRQQPSPPRHDWEPIFNASSCIWINFISYGRSGNRLIQLRHVNEILSRCSGVAVTRAGTNDDTTVFFPPTLIAPAFPNHNLVSHKALEVAARMCREVNYSSAVFKDAKKNCGGAQYRLQQEWWTKDNSTGLDLPALLPQVMVEKRAWEHTFDKSTMLMYFRGGDILRVNPQPKYSQAPCSLFLESWNLIAPERAMLIYDQNAAINPCVHVVEQHIPAHQRIPPPCAEPGCHMTLIGRAPYVVVSGVSTFADNSLSLFPEQKRAVFRYFCNKEPRLDGNTLHLCVNGSTQGFIPWNYTDSTRDLMLNTSSGVVLGVFNTSYIKEHVQHTFL